MKSCGIVPPCWKFLKCIFKSRLASCSMYLPSQQKLTSGVTLQCILGMTTVTCHFCFQLWWVCTDINFWSISAYFMAVKLVWKVYVLAYPSKNWHLVLHYSAFWVWLLWHVISVFSKYCWWNVHWYQFLEYVSIFPMMQLQTGSHNPLYAIMHEGYVSKTLQLPNVDILIFYWKCRFPNDWNSEMYDWKFAINLFPISWGPSFERYQCKSYSI